MDQAVGASHDPLSVDALINLFAVAFQSPKPTATVALARGLSPASGPKRVLAARKAGLLPDTEPGKPAGALTPRTGWSAVVTAHHPTP